MSVKTVFIGVVIVALAFLGYEYVYKPVNAVASYVAPSTQVTNLSRLGQTLGLSADKSTQAAQETVALEGQFAANTFGPLAPIITIPSNAILNFLGL